MIQKLNGTIKSSFPKLLFLVSWIFAPILLSIISFVSWNYSGICFIVYLSFIFYHLYNCERLHFYKYLIVTFIFLTSWHIGALFWMFSIDKGIYGLFANLIINLIPFIVFHTLKKNYNIKVFTFIPIWLVFEYFQNSCHFSYPWLTLGNLLSNQTYLAQWYQFTGVLGGSLWLLLISYFIFQNLFLKKNKIKLLFIILFVPSVFSLLLLFNKTKVIDPEKTEHFITYNNQYNTQKWQKDKLAFEIIKNIDAIKKFKSLLIPEQTFRGMYNKNFTSSLTKHYFKDLIENKVVENVFIGTTGFLKKDFLLNASFAITKDTVYGKVKKRLVPYTEYMFPQLYLLFDKKFYRGDVPDTSEQIINSLQILPLICYESVYSFFVADKIKNASYIYVLSSELFMNSNKFGMNQYDNIIRLRAIENNRPIIKASNYGWSMAISPTGKVLKKSKSEINYFEVSFVKNNTSLYSKYGSKPILGVILILLFFSFYTKKKNHDKSYIFNYIFNYIFFMYKI